MSKLILEDIHVLCLEFIPTTNIYIYNIHSECYKNKSILLSRTKFYHRKFNSINIIILCIITTGVQKI